jgi:1-acyl-sn-glycerol-3-phosphate acyltransferase
MTSSNLLRTALQDVLLAPALRTWCTSFQVSGADALDARRGPFLLVANHSSHLDAPAVLSALPRHLRRRTVVAAAEDYFYRDRLIGLLASLGVGTFPFPRQGDAGLERAAALLADGWNVLLFPEGTRSADGDLHRFRSGVGRLQAMTRVLVVPVAIVGTHALWPKGCRLPSRGSVEIRFGKAWLPEPCREPCVVADDLAGQVAALKAAPPAAHAVGRVGKMAWAVARRAFLALGGLSEGIHVGRKYGFSSGEMLDYVYEDRARGCGPLGRLIDRAYLSSVGWRGIRERRTNLVRTLSAIVLARRAQGKPTRILDVAAGPGRYLLDLAEGLGGDDLAIECRDADADALARGRTLAASRGLTNVCYVQHDALDAAALAAIRPVPDVVVASGLYEILLDDDAIRASLCGIGALLPPGGLLVLTGQPRHPQLKLIANLLTHRDGTPWRMRPRPIHTLEGWCREAGLVDLQTQGDTQGIFTITIGRKPTRLVSIPRAGGAGVTRVPREPICAATPTIAMQASTSPS